jgi:hypothetical protein
LDILRNNAKRLIYAFLRGNKKIRIDRFESLNSDTKKLTNQTQKLHLSSPIPENGIAELIERPGDVNIDHEAHL